MAALYRWAACLDWIMSSRIPRSENWTVRRVLDDLENLKLSSTDAKANLERVGLGLIVPGMCREIGGCCALAVPNASPLVASLFDGTEFAAYPEDDLDGRWSEALRDGAPADVVFIDKRINRVRIGGVQRRCTLVVVSRMRKYRIAD